MAQKPLDQATALEWYGELQRRVSVGAYVELQFDGSFPPDDGTAESGTLESLHNLETWAARQGLEFCWTPATQKWSLEPIEAWRQESVNEAMRARNQFQALQEEE
jgi:hypothetical protein